MSLNGNLILRETPQTWVERLKELKSQGRNNSSTGEYPRLLTTIDSAKGQFVLRAKEMTSAPVALSGERYPDYPGSQRVINVLYVVAETDKHGLSEFWDVVGHLSGGYDHTCGAYCVKHELPEFVMKEK